MNKNIRVKRALISVSNKEGLVDFAQGLAALNIEIISTGGTSKLLRAANIPVKEVADITQFPEIMDGRVKTLHPLVHGGILGRRDEHADVAKAHHIQWIDLVIVNLYPFAETINKPNVTFEEAIENIDIGGPAMIRSAAKNMQWVGVVVDPSDYGRVLAELQQGLSEDLRYELAAKAFAHTSSYDGLIQQFLSERSSKTLPDKIFPNTITWQGKKFDELRYGENPHQKASAFHLLPETQGILSAKQYQGKPLSYNNIVDADAAYACLHEFKDAACVVVKHANPCGVATADNIDQAFIQAFNADAKSAFGGVVALNRACTKEIALALEKIFIEVLIAPSYTQEALTLLASKTNLRVLELPLKTQFESEQEFKFIQGGVLIQDRDNKVLAENNLKIVTQRQVSAKEMDSLLFAWNVVKHVKSNAILIAKDNVTLGVGAGQVSRVDAVHIALQKAGADLSEAVLASDAFFPFRDSIDSLKESGIKAIIQPGGSIRDDEVIAACNEYDMAMVFTGQRCFKH
jgi:phosphoribosylaminoimidazolecarboxamide formyltransferase/IMP cyclohydrolase